MTKKRTPKLFVVFDTNVLYTQVASDLVRKDVHRIISNNSEHPDLAVSWYLPEVVIGERRYQMLERAKALLPNMQKLERLVGVQFGVNENNLELYVEKAIKDNCADLNLQKIGLNTEMVDWQHIIESAVSRKPPFEPAEKEKGFRDSIIAQTFLQLLQRSPATPHICRLALVSEDELLRKYVGEATINAKNVRVLSGLDELESLINTLVSTIPEDFAVEMARKAEKLFFEKGNDKTIYYKESIGERIRDQYTKELADAILPGKVRENGTWWVMPPVFQKKEKQRIYWVSSIELEFEISHYEKEKQDAGRQLGLGELLNSRDDASKNELSRVTTLADSLSSYLAMKKVTDLKGREKFEVLWSANLSQAHNLTSPRLEEIRHVGNNLNEGGA